MDTLSALAYLFMLLFMVSIFHDIFRTGIAKIKKEDYEWASSNFFTNMDSALPVFIFGIVLALGIYAFYDDAVSSISKQYEKEIAQQIEYAEFQANKDLARCYYCDREVSIEFMYIEGNKEICPKCIYGDYQYILENLSEIGNVFSDDYMLVERTMCNHCGDSAPAMLRDPNEEPICIDCMNKAVQNKNVANALNHYFEYG